MKVDSGSEEPHPTASQPFRSPPPEPMSRRHALAGLLGLGLSLLARRASAISSPRIPWDERMELAVTFDLVHGDGNSRRPYVAVWIEDPQGRSVRTISLWIQRGRLTWISHLRRWFRAERVRQGESGGNLMNSSSSATRQAGRYTVVWNGRTDAIGPLVQQGRYFLCIEAVRHGYMTQLIRQDFDFGSAPFVAELAGNSEIGGVHVEYRERS
jgi:FAD:protein FMN transferase